MSTRQERVEVFQDTLAWIREDAQLKQALEAAQKATKVFYEDDYPEFDASKRVNTRISVSRDRSFQAAMRLKREHPEARVAVMNFANAFHPGGGVAGGASAQEECLCRTSTLYPVLDRREMKDTYYRHHYELNSPKATDSLIYTKGVVVCKTDEDRPRRMPREQWVTVDVITIAAPDLRDQSNFFFDLVNGGAAMSGDELFECHVKRITHMLTCAAAQGAQILVLGAFGCGAFQNDPEVVAAAFKKALEDFPKVFRCIEFAVYCPPQGSRNYEVFKSVFMTRERYQNAIRGCLVGGAVGDALGYAIEFSGEADIFARYGESGITEYECDRRNGKALISDDTQMTLFTGCGLLVGQTRRNLRGIAAAPRHYVAMAYQDWLRTQEMSYAAGSAAGRDERPVRVSWLRDVPELYSRRAPGNTCLSALHMRQSQEVGDSYIDSKINDSKGCGGIMRVAPMALCYDHVEIEKIDMEGAEIAAITHSHSLGYMPAAVLAHILHSIVFGDGRQTLKEIVREARDTAEKLFAGDPHLKELTDIMNLAVELSENTCPDLENIHRLGEGWVAEETLGIALYCALKYADDFSAGVIAAVNHKGDSDSTGAVTGNILGALLGLDSIDQKWKKDLELYDVIVEMADDLCFGCRMSEHSAYKDPDWERKYIHMQWKDAKQD